MGGGDFTVRCAVNAAIGELHGFALAFNQMAEGLQGRNLETKKIHETLQRYHQQDSALRELNLAITSTLDLQAVLRLLMEKIDVLLPHMGIRVWLINPESIELERAACLNIDESEWKSRKLHEFRQLTKR